MKIKRDDIKTFIVIAFVCIICILMVLLINHKNNFDKLTHVNEYNMYFTNTNYINKYINYIANNDYTWLYNLLDKRYIEENSITYDNVLNSVDSYSTGSSIKVTNMQYVQVKDNYIYYVEGDIYTSNYNGQILVDDDFAIIILTDYNNLSYSLYPVYDNYKKVINNIKDIVIENNDYNRITAAGLISKEQVCAVYLSNFISNIDSSYDILSDDMVNKYSTESSYIEFINNNINKFSSTADKCRMDEDDGKRVYTVIDSNENTYVFTEEFIMNYKVDFYMK